MLETKTEIIEPERVTKYFVLNDGKQLRYGEVLELWLHDHEFRRFFTDLLSSSEYAAFRWETPAITIETVDRPFEFVLLNTIGFASRASDSQTFSKQFKTADENLGVVAFANIGGDATLVVPTPQTDHSAYGHLAAFLRLAPKQQSEALWQVVAKSARSLLGKQPIWINTAGGGVAWLHVRLDSRPKYYGYAEYRKP